MSLGMSKAKIISLKGYRAHQCAVRLRRLPPSLRTPERAEPALEAIVAYAWEPADNDRGAEPALICSRLEEFVPAKPSGLEGIDRRRISGCGGGSDRGQAARAGYLAMGL